MSAAKDRLDALLKAQADDKANLARLEEGSRSLRESILVRTGRIDELRRIVAEEGKASG